ncbi:hypothetical protein Pfo_010376 [Paulownia fortunei]|nr:hypothetical protein Pfo_010376 [Paulownia fortunei]
MIPEGIIVKKNELLCRETLTLLPKHTPQLSPSCDFRWDSPSTSPLSLSLFEFSICRSETRFFIRVPCCLESAWR